MKRILITGASGMLGATLAKLLSKNFSVFGTGNSAYESSDFQYRPFDLTSTCYSELIEWSQPDIVVHCGALTNGNFCQQNPGIAMEVNGLSVSRILKATQNNVKIIYISTDAVFPSSLNLAKEKDCVSPENVYGKSKELGEFFLSSSTDRKYTIIRTTIVGLNLNENKSGFVEWILNSAKNNQKLGLFSDVLFSPISIWDLCEEIEYLIRSENVNSEVLHIAGQTCTKYTFGKQLLEELNISTESLEESSIANFTDRAKRSNDQSMSSEFYQQKYGRVLPNLSQTIKKIKNFTS